MDNPDVWTPTCELRWHKHVTGRYWTTQWNDQYTLALEQKWVSQTGLEEWRELPSRTTQAENQVHLA